MQRKRFVYLLAILALLVSMLPLSAAAQEAPPASFQIQEFAPSDNKALDGSGAAGPALPFAPDGMAFFNETEPNDTSATANALPGSQVAVYGTISPATEVDFFSFTANAGDRVYASTQTLWSNGGSTDTVLDIYASDGATVLETDDDSGSFSGTASAIGGTIIPAAGTYYIRVDGFSTTATITPYYLHVRVQSGAPTPEVEPNNTTATATPLAASGWMSGTITATTDPDLFSFSLNAGDSVFLGLDMDPGRLPSNTNWNGRVGLGLFNNFLLVANDDSTVKPHAEAFFMTVKEAGTYYAYVDSISATGLGANARYQLSVSIYPKQVQNNCTTITSTDVPKTIGPGIVTTTSTIVVPPTITSAIQDINATLVLTHSLMVDLDVTLLGPTAVSVPLFTDVGSTAIGGQTQMNLGLDDQAALPVGPFTVVSGMVNQPEQPGRLAGFNGTPAGGVWTLQIADDLSPNSGRLQSWSLEICGDPPPPYAIELNKTVGTEPAVCATTDSVTVPPGGFDVYYCYTVRNTGLNTLNVHDLADSELGTIFTGVNYALAPGATYSHIQQATIYDTVTNTGTWTASDGPNSASDSDTATVNVRAMACPAGYQPVTVDASFFGNPFPPAGWSVTNTSVGCTPPGLPDWTNTNPGLRANLTGGIGPFAIADSDRCGTGSTLDTIMTTGLLDFTGLVSPTVSFNSDYDDIGVGGDKALLDVSADGGATWANLLTWDSDQRGPRLVTQALPGAAGENDVQVRWHYAQGTYDWWWQVDSAFLTACEPLVPAIALTKTVGTTSGVCATTDEITVSPGTTVYYCYEVTNTGDVTLNLHDLVDDQLGTIFTGLNYALTPGSSVNTVTAGLSIPAVINATTTNTATWTAYNPGGPSVQATDTATVTVQAPNVPAIELNKTVGTIPGVCAAGDNITVTAGTEVYYCYQVENTGDVTFEFHDLVDSDLGTILNDLPYTLAPGAFSPQVIVTDTPMATVTNVGTWTAVTALDAYVVDDTIPYNWQDISGTGTSVALTDDSVSGALPIGFPFEFYGTAYTDIYASSNGFLTVLSGSSNGCCTGGILPSTTTPNGVIAGWWEDLNLSAGGTVHYQTLGTAPNRVFIVQYTDVPHYPDGYLVTKQYKLFETSNVIEVHYQAAPSDGGTHSAGIENAAGTLGLQYYRGTSALTTPLAVRYSLVTIESATDTDTATVTVLTPNIDVDPLSYNVLHAAPQVTTAPITIANTGQGDLVWNIAEEATAVRPAPLTGGDAAVAAEVVDPSDLKPQGQPAAAAPLSEWRAPEAVLYDNGGLITHPTGGAGGAAASSLQTAIGLNTYGFGNQVSVGNRVADDFTVTGGGWFVDTITFFGYQTGSSTTSSFTALNLRIWDGPPNDAGSMVVFGDTSTNRLASSTWTNIYRASDTNLLDSTRPIMTLAATVNTFLPAGTYWVDWQVDGALASGPWAPPVTILGQTGKPGANALQFTSTGWAALIDTGTAEAPQDLPFIVEGSAECSNLTDLPWLSTSPANGVNVGGSSTAGTVSFDSTSLANGTYTANLCVFSNDPDPGPGNETGLVIVPVTLTLTAPQEPAIVITKTVGLVSGVCATTSTLDVAAGTTVYYCYTVTNTGDVTLNDHDLVDDQLGTIFTGLNYALTPGSSVNTVAAGLSIPAVINTTTTNVATWTAAQSSTGGLSATDTATATVNVASIEIAKTVGTEPGVCAATSTITVPAGTTVYYCYTVTNTGDVTLNLHDLSDDVLGTIFSGLAYALTPGSSVNTVAAGLSIPYVATAPTTNTATWTAYNQGGPSVTDEASAFVDVIYFSCENPEEDFENGVPAWGWSVVNNAGGASWGNIASCGPNGSGGNWTGGLGDAACMSPSSLTGGAYDAELRTPVFSLVGYSNATISYLANYQNWTGNDRLNLDISMDGGVTWTTLRTWNSDQGVFQNTPGVFPTVDLADYLGMPNLMLRWHYFWDNPDALGWYAQIDGAEFKCVEIPPTAVTLDGLSAAQAPLPLSGLPLAALPAAVSLALGAAYVLRRKA